MCTGCSKKRLNSINNAPQVHYGTVALESIVFLELYYIGDENAIISTVLPNVTYGQRQYGEKMFVAQQDFLLHPELWSENEPSNFDNN